MVFKEIRTPERPKIAKTKNPAAGFTHFSDLIVVICFTWFEERQQRAQEGDRSKKKIQRQFWKWKVKKTLVRTTWLTIVVRPPQPPLSTSWIMPLRLCQQRTLCYTWRRPWLNHSTPSTNLNRLLNQTTMKMSRMTWPYDSLRQNNALKRWKLTIDPRLQNSSCVYKPWKTPFVFQMWNPTQVTSAQCVPVAPTRIIINLLTLWLLFSLIIACYQKTIQNIIITAITVGYPVVLHLDQCITPNNKRGD